MKQWKLRPFVFTVLVLFNGVFLLMISSVTYFGISYIMENQISNARLEMLINTQHQFRERMTQIEETALTISTDRNLQRALNSDKTSVYDLVQIRRDLNKWLDSFTYIKPYINSIQIYTNRFDNIPVVGGNRKNIILPFSRIPWEDEMHHFDTRDAIWIPAHYDHFTDYGKRKVLTYVLRIYNNKVEPIGYVAVNLSVDSFSPSFFDQNSNLGAKERQIVLVHPSGRIMSRIFETSDESYTLQQAYTKEIDQLESHQGYRKINVDGTPYLIMYTTQSSTTWRLIEIITMEKVYDEMRNVRILMLMLGAVFLLFTFPIASFLSNRMIQPIPSLLRGFQKIENGFFDIQLKERSIVELNRLFLSFNNMAKRLKLLLEELEQKHRNERDLEMKVLQSQINPHFLYNTLDMINWIAAVKGNEDVSMMASKLAQLYRISIKRDSMFITLKEELEHARSYVEIQQARFKDRFKYIEQVSPQVMQYYVPKIIIQPFIENALIHGFDEMLQEKAEVIVSAYTEPAGNLYILIEDNGSGIKSENTKNKTKNKKTLSVSGSGGYGIQNVRDRILNSFGSKYGVDVANRNQGGVCVTIRLPLISSLVQLKEYERNLDGGIGYESIDRG